MHRYIAARLRLSCKNQATTKVSVSNLIMCTAMMMMPGSSRKRPRETTTSKKINKRLHLSGGQHLRHETIAAVNLMRCGFVLDMVEEKTRFNSEVGPLHRNRYTKPFTHYTLVDIDIWYTYFTSHIESVIIPHRYYQN